MKTACTTGQLAKFLGLLSQKDSTPEEFQKRLSSGALADIFDPKAVFNNRVALRKALGLKAFPDDEGFEVVVDYGKTLDEMLIASGVKRITERFSEESPYAYELAMKKFTIVGQGVVRRKLVFVPIDNDPLTKVEVFKYLSDRDCRPAKLEDALALFEQHPRAWSDFPNETVEELCAIGTAVQDNGVDCFPTISYLSDGRGGGTVELAVGDFSMGGLYDNYCLLAVLK